MRRNEKNGFAFVLIHLMALALACTAWARVAGEAQQMPAGISSDWWTQAQAHIRQVEYQPSLARVAGTDQAQTLQAPNRAHNFRTTFTADSMRVAPRTASAPEWSWGLTLTGLGAPGELRPAEPAQLRHEGNRVELVRGPVIEWYRNDERGLEQGFTLPEPPQGSAGAAELVLRLAVQGTLSGSLDPDGSALTFAAPDGRPRLRFDHLLAVDAVGRHLPARFGLGDGYLDIIVATAGAQYPILIDPLATSPNWTAESNQAGAWFGYSVASAGDVNGDGYDDVIVGAPAFDGGQAGEGAALVYLGSDIGLSTTPSWAVDSDQAVASFGWSVSTAGDVNGDGYDDVLIGAYLFDNGQNNEGRAYVFHGSASGLSWVANWTTESDQANAQYGYSVATAGDVNNDGYADIVVGAPYYDNGHEDEGRIYVYHGSDSGLSPVADTSVESNFAHSTFGYSVSTAGDVNRDGYSDVIVGAHNYSNGHSYEGRVSVFHGSAIGIFWIPTWIAESGQEYAHFGVSVSTAGDVNGDGYDDVIIGAYGYNNRGAAYVFYGSEIGLQLGNRFAQGDQEDAKFGLLVSTAGDVNADGFSDVIVGAPWHDNGQVDEGKVFVFHGSANGLATMPKWTHESNQASAYFGRSIASAGDVNGDGAADIIVGSFTYSNGQPNEGKAFVFYGSGGSFFLIPNPAGKPAIIYLE